MAITVQYSDPVAIGQASLAIGQGQFAQDREQQAMRERQMALEEAAFAEQQQQNDFRNQFAVQQFGADQYNRDRALRYGAYQDAQQMGLRQQALQQDAMGRQQMVALQQAEMAARQQQAREQQQMLAARDQMQIVSQVERDRQNQMAKMAAVEWDAIQKARADGRTFINDSHYQSAVQKWQDKYSALNQPMPIDLPFMEQPAIPETLSSFYGEYGIPFDEQTGEPLVSPQVQNQIIQARSQEKQAALKAQQEQQKLELEERKSVEEGFAQAQKEQQAEQKKLEDWRNKFIETEMTNEAKRRMEMEYAGTDKEGKSQAISREESWLKYPPSIVQSQEQYAMIPDNTAYMDLDGKIWVKGYEKQGPKN